jgi:hypothetical protein
VLSRRLSVAAGTRSEVCPQGARSYLQRRAIERQAYTCREQFASRGDKAVRAQSMRGRMAMLGLYVRQGAPWFADLRAELLSFRADAFVQPVGDWTRLGYAKCLPTMREKNFFGNAPIACSGRLELT